MATADGLRLFCEKLHVIVMLPPNADVGRWRSNSDLMQWFIASGVQERYLYLILC